MAVKIQCKFHDLDVNALETKSLDELAECGCERCSALWEKKDYQRLQALEQDVKLRQEAEKQGELLGKVLESKALETQQAYEQIQIEAAKKYLERKGIDLEALAKAPFWNKIERKGVGALQNKNIHVITGVGQREYENKLFEKYLRTGDQQAWMELKTLKYSADPATDTATYTVPDDFLNQLIRKRHEQSIALRSGVNIRRIAGKSIDIPLEGNGVTGGWVANQGDDLTGTDPTFAQLTLTPSDYAVLITVTRQLLRDSAIDIAAEVANMMSRHMARKVDESIFNGPLSGPGPVGIAQDTEKITNTVAPSDDTNGNISPDDLIDAVFAIEPQYHANLRWFMHPRVGGFIRKMKDANGRYLWDTDRSGLSDGIHGRLLEIPVSFTTAMPYDPTNGGVIVLGDLSFYEAAECGPMEFARDDSRYFEKNMVAFRAIMSLDGRVSHGEAFCRIAGVKGALNADGSPVN